MVVQYVKAIGGGVNAKFLSGILGESGSMNLIRVLTLSILLVNLGVFGYFTLFYANTIAVWMFVSSLALVFLASSSLSDGKQIDEIWRAIEIEKTRKEVSARAACALVYDQWLSALRRHRSRLCGVAFQKGQHDRILAK